MMTNTNLINLKKNNISFIGEIKEPMVEAPEEKLQQLHPYPQS
jgi:hypothetical protein